MNLHLFIANKMRSRGLSSLSNLISCISVAVSIAVIVVAIAISNGFKKEISSRAVGFSGEIVMTVPGSDYLNDEYPLDANLSYREDILSLDEIKALHNVAYKPGMLKSDDAVHGVLFKGVDSLYSFDFYSNHLTEGRMPDFSGAKLSNEVLISQRLAQKMGYNLGDKLTVYFISGQVRVRRFDIVGLYNIQLDDLDEKLILADIRQIRRLNGWKGEESSCIEVFLEQNGTMRSYYDRVLIDNQIAQIIMNRDRDLDAPVAVTLIDNIFPSLFDWLGLLDLNVLVVLVLMIAVAGFNMISGLLIILFEKISMIGLLKSLGMRTWGICKVFMYKGSQIVLKGMLYGNIFAVAILLVQKYTQIITLNPENYFVNFVPIDLSILQWCVINVAAFAINMLIMAVPTLFISKVSPDKSIKVN